MNGKLLPATVIVLVVVGLAAVVLSVWNPVWVVLAVGAAAGLFLLAAPYFRPDRPAPQQPAADPPATEPATRNFLPGLAPAAQPPARPAARHARDTVATEPARARTGGGRHALDTMATRQLDKHELTRRLAGEGGN